jgi:15-cis-phytoene synthase
VTPALQASYRYCRQIARSRAGNFYYSFVLLSKPQRDAMCAVYAFMRRSDDLADEPGRPVEAARAALEEWRQELDRALDSGTGAYPGWPALLDSIARYRIPHRYFAEMIEGVGSDLGRGSIGSFEELYRYCYQVASVVGLVTVHIFGFEDPRALALAEKCGIAFQLTNILRDLREDALAGRVYLPEEDLLRFGVSPADLAAAEPTPALRDLVRFEAARAAEYYRESAPLIGLVAPASRPSLAALIGIYWRLLDRIGDCGYDVLSRRIRLTALEKSAIVARAALGLGLPGAAKTSRPAL